MPNHYAGPSTFQLSPPEMTRLGSILPRSLLSPSAVRTNSSPIPNPRTPVTSPLPRPRARGIQSAPNTRVEKLRKSRRSLPGTFPESIHSRSPSPSPSSSNRSEPDEERSIFGQLSVAPSHVDDRIRKRVSESLTPKQPKPPKPSNQVLNGSKGYVYIFEAANQPGVFKIGSTERTVTDRKKEIERDCGLKLNEHYRSELSPFPQRAEKLCHEMLSFYRRRYACSKCKNPITERAVLHEEWFEVPLEVAKNCAYLWTTFLRERPYDADGSLSLFWRERLENTERCHAKEEHCDYQIRHQRWHTYVSASHFAKARHQLARILTDCRDIDFWRTWFNILFILSLFVSFLHWWMGEMLPWLPLTISAGYFLPAQIIRDSKK